MSCKITQNLLKTEINLAIVYLHEQPLALTIRTWEKSNTEFHVLWRTLILLSTTTSEVRHYLYQIAKPQHEAVPTLGRMSVIFMKRASQAAHVFCCPCPSFLKML